MNESATQTESGEVRIFKLASIKNGSGMLDRIASEPPQPEPDLIEHRAKMGVDTESGTAAEHTSTTDADGRTVLHVDPKDYAHIKDHKGNSFDPAKHKVTPDGKPDFNARGRVKMLATGETNAVKLIFEPLKKYFPSLNHDSDEGRSSEEREAQGAVILNDELSRVNAECIADMYEMSGYVIVGKKFTKAWKERRSRLVTSLMHYDRVTGGGLVKVTPNLLLVHAFGSDFAMVAGGEMFDQGGGLFGWWKKLKNSRKRAPINPGAEVKGDTDAA